ncbi:MAG: HEAT repeat domain-containing protein [Anaerolineales bacterium]|nr:HEAT repeat domain-containing protein [Anaerolineales bacterium]
MNWLTGSKQNDIKRLMTHLADSTKRDSAARELISLGADSAAPLIAALQTQDANLIPLYQQILARIPSATPELIRQFKSAHPLVRGRIAEIFFFSKDKAAIPALLEALKGEYFTVRSRAAFALANMDDARVIPYLLPLLKDAEAEVRSAACMSIAKFRDPSTFDDIANILLDDPKLETRQSAARALGDTKHPAAIQYLMEALRDSIWWFEREHAVADLLTAIEKMGYASVEPLLESLADKEATVRKFAAIALGQIGDPRAIEELGMALYDLHNEVRKAAADSLAKFGAPTMDYFIEALQHPEPPVRENAVIGLAKIQDARVGGVLIEALRDPERNVRKQALIALDNLRERRAIPMLQELVADRSDREMGMLAKQILETFK